MTERETYIKSIVDYLERIGSDTFVRCVYVLVKSVYTQKSSKVS